MSDTLELKVYDENDNRIAIDDLEPENGKLVSYRRLVAHHDAVKASPRRSHYKVLKTYPNGGQDLEEIVDEEAHEARDAYDEYENAYRFVPYTDEERVSLAQNTINSQVQDQVIPVLSLLASKATNLTDSEASSIISFLPEYDQAASYTAGQLVRRDGGVYRATGDVQLSSARIMSVTDDGSSDIGWKVVQKPSDEWIRPMSVHFAYSKGAEVSHFGHTWKSTVDYNVWEPTDDSRRWMMLK